MKNYILILITMLSLVSCRPRKLVDAIYYHATIYMVDSNFRTADAMAVDSGRIIAIGNESDIRAHFSTSNWNDLEGKYVYPGFIDAHSHFLGFGLGLRHADLFGAKSMDEIVSRLKEHQSKQHSEYVFGSPFTN